MISHQHPFQLWKVSLFLAALGIPQVPSFEFKGVTVLLWTEVRGHKLIDESTFTQVLHSGELAQTLKHCPINCRITSDRRLHFYSDAVVFEARHIQKNDLPKYVRHNQVLVFLTQEPPIASRWDLQAMPNIFNWTMTYSRDSEVFHPFGVVLPENHRESPSFNFLGKKRLVAYEMRDCEPGRRHEYLLALQRLIQVDVIGECGEFVCTGVKERTCLEEIATEYKFYLVEEDFFCTEYISAAVFDALEHSIIPVLFGYADYNSALPPHSFINARDFGSPKTLAEYLSWLSTDEEAYSSYFAWKRDYSVIKGGTGWCSLCIKLSRRNSLDRVWYKDVWSWWWNISRQDAIIRSRLEQGLKHPKYSKLNINMQNHDKIAHNGSLQNITTCVDRLYLI